ncbi:amidohydrolase [Clostridium sp. PL3]|uniref:Amidohydrolase n=1 Tax=Clostridium thailandense TaxID=2794346 RepID=A0A949TXP0_9CLOT|nr:amidohydrolase family protein [Clostridium thailandense]MBV7274463.1 amidohydrolase [Clostridium thailandense]
MKRIDFENHFYDISVIEALAERTEYPYYRKDTNIINWAEGLDMPQGVLLPMLLEVGEKRLKLMDELKIDTAVISCSPGAEQLDVNVSIDVCKKTNDVLYRVTQAYPRRFIGSAILPVKNIDAACEELERCVKELGFVAWHAHSNFGHASPDELKYRPIFKKAAELGVYVYLHPQLPNMDRVCDLGFTFAGPGLGFTMDTVITILRMIATGLFDEIPNLNVLLGHLGEGIPFLLDRIDNRMNFLPNAKLSNKQLPSYYFKKNIMVTTSGNMSPEAFKCTKEVLGIDRILFGSDHPFENAADMVKFVDNLSITDDEREMMYYKNAKKLNVF